MSLQDDIDDIQNQIESVSCRIREIEEFAQGSPDVLDPDLNLSGIHEEYSELKNTLVCLLDDRRYMYESAMREMD